MQILRKMINLLLIGLLSIGFIGHASAQPTTQTSILNGINAYRIAQGLPKLKLDSKISQLATEHSQQMASHKIAFGHGGFSDRTHDLFGFFPHAQSMAENVAYADQDDSQSIVKSWINSSGHRRNIVGRYNLTGIGVARDANGRVYATQIFVNSGKLSPQNNSFQQTFKHALSFNW